MLLSSSTRITHRFSLTDAVIFCLGEHGDFIIPYPDSESFNDAENKTSAFNDKQSRLC